MDYFSQSLLFKLKKVLRYIRMYGIRRTYIKVQGQLHMQRKYSEFPKTHNRPLQFRHIIGIMGCGNYAFSNIVYYLKKHAGDVIAGCMDTDIHRAASLAEYFHLPFYTDQPKHIFECEQVKLIYIASNHASHAEYAIDALQQGKDVYIEKPHVVTEDQLIRLVDTMHKTSGRVFLGFNRPNSRFGKIIKKYLDKESGAAMFNWFVAGHEIDPGHWYFKPEEGGRILGNLCHWTDFILRLVPSNTYPIKITPTRAEKSDCDIAVTYVFGEGTIAAITFSAKGHTFEGVKERFSAHKGNCLISMDDYKTLAVEVVDDKKRFFNFFRDHGHGENILSGFRVVTEERPYDRDAVASYIWNSGWLFLKTKEALEGNRTITIHSYYDRHLDSAVQKS